MDPARLSRKLNQQNVNDRVVTYIFIFSGAPYKKQLADEVAAQRQELDQPEDLGR